jgi:hypothetical protein
LKRWPDPRSKKRSVGEGVLKGKTGACPYADLIFGKLNSRSSRKKIFGAYKPNLFLLYFPEYRVYKRGRKVI